MVDKVYKSDSLDTSVKWLRKHRQEKSTRN